MCRRIQRQPFPAELAYKRQCRNFSTQSILQPSVYYRDYFCNIFGCNYLFYTGEFIRLSLCNVGCCFVPFLSYFGVLRTFLFAYGTSAPIYSALGSPVMRCTNWHNDFDTAYILKRMIAKRSFSQPISLVIFFISKFPQLKFQSMTTFTTAREMRTTGCKQLNIWAEHSFITASTEKLEFQKIFAEKIINEQNAALLQRSI